MNKILNRPMFQRQRFAPGGGAKKIFDIKKPFSSGIAVIGDRARKLNQWDKGVKVRPDGSWDIKSRPHTGFKKFIIPNRKSL